MRLEFHPEAELELIEAAVLYCGLIASEAGQPTPPTQTPELPTKEKESP
jgi:hypothetical protein